MRDYEVELRNRVQFIRDCLEAASAQGIVYGNSGGKDSALVGILCKKACENTVGLIMPCRSRRSYHQDRRDAEAFAQQFGIAARVVDPGRCWTNWRRGRKCNIPHRSGRGQYGAASEDDHALCRGGQ